MWYVFNGDDMETRKAKLIVGSAGGTAGKGSKTYKILYENAVRKQQKSRFFGF